MTTDTRYCPNCDADTLQEVVDDTHERDSSGDYRECLTCRWVYTGTSGKYRPPRIPPKGDDEREQRTDPGAPGDKR